MTNAGTLEIFGYKQPLLSIIGRVVMATHKSLSDGCKTDTRRDHNHANEVALPVPGKARST